MTHKFGAFALAAAVAGVCSAGAWAQREFEETPAAIPAVELQPHSYGPTLGGRRPLMSLLEDTALGEALDNAGLRLYGHVQGSYTYNFKRPMGHLNLGRVFDIEHGEPTLNQLTLNLDRVVDLTRNEFDVGGRIEMLYGGDARFIKANGMFDHHDFFDGPENQFDIPQAYVDVVVPLDRPLRLRAGKFTYFKQLDPIPSVFYSHSFTFGGALPFTLTGITGQYQLSDELGLELGVVRGWDQALEDNNNAPSYLGRLRYAASDRTMLVLSGISGPEQEDNSRDCRNVLNLTLSHQVDDRLTILGDSVIGWGNNEIFDRVLPGGGLTPVRTDAVYYGLAGYAIYELNEYISPAVRVEWFRDEDGLATGADHHLFGVTLGATITPMPHDRWGQNLKIRPEVRWDNSSIRYFDGLRSRNQVTFGVDMIYSY